MNRYKHVNILNGTYVALHFSFRQIHLNLQGYGALKNINKQTCIITKSPVPMASDRKYRIVSLYDFFRNCVNTSKACMWIKQFFS